MKTSNGSKKEGAVDRHNAPGGGTCLRAGEDPFDEVLCASFDEVYWRHKLFILQGIRRHLKSRASQSLVDDICQEVCIKLNRCLGGVPGAVANPSRELLERLVSNQVRSQTRTEARQRINGEPDDDPAPASSSNPELLYGRAQEAVHDREHLKAIFTRLEPAVREVLTLVEIDEMSHEDAAARIGCSTKTLAVRLHRARYKFAEVGRQLDQLRQRQRRKG